ncbi:MAG: UvrD-helicase domain-containing protein [Opitutales bacterium]|nr:UvrD-helicase domain-containing protein [Opitutales bacterium]
MPELTHEMILASAGSGKTHTLAVRYIRLLAQGADPRRIVALTFTRKAAGEFLARILQRLAAAASDPTQAAALARETGQPDFDASAARRLLRSMVEALPQLHLSTLDSFFHEIVRVFAYELGIDPSFQLLDPQEAEIAREDTLNTVFRPADEAARDHFMQAWKRYSYGGRTKTVSADLQNLLRNYHALYLDCPHADRWMPPLHTFPRVSRYLAAAQAYTSRLQAWQAALEPLDDPPKLTERLREAALEAEKWSPGMSHRHLKALTYTLPHIFAGLPDLESTGTIELEMFRKRRVLSGEVAAATLAFFEALIGAELLRAAEASGGLFPILEAYERVYETAVRGRGQLTFPDLPHLLRGGARAHDLTLGQTGDAHPARLLIDYRLDARFDHWLLDEFQDTSRVQWDVLANLLDEVIQDAGGDRSFFVVGDIKQSIYGWRGGDSTLFESIRSQYGDRLRQATLDRSFRSSPPVIDFINAVFGSETFLRQLAPEVTARWQRDWQAHSSARPTKPGCAAVHFVDKDDDRPGIVASMIEHLAPREKGLSCAILVRRNHDIHPYIEALRSAGIPAVREGEVRIATDNPIGLAFLATLRVLAVPGDTFHWAHLHMTPLAPWIGECGSDGFVARALVTISESGFTGFFEEWCRHLRAEAPPGAFGELRMEQLRDACLQLDRRPVRECARAARLLENHTLSESASPRSVQVMTIHKAKGLGFDVVFLPEIGGDSFGKGGQTDLLVQRDADDAVQWISGSPMKDVRRHIAAFANIEDRMSAADAFEEICVFYVACTRAAHALYILAQEPPAKTVSLNAISWLNTLAPPEETVADPLLPEAGPPRSLFGDPTWFAKCAPSAPAAPAPPIRLPEPPARSSAAPLPRTRPSTEAPHTPLPLDRMLSPGARAARRLGSTLHDALGAIEWWPAGDPAPTPPANLPSEARDILAAFLASPAATEVFARPDQPATLWREQAFEVIIGGNWISGVFDRVVLTPETATIYDFKTDLDPTPEALRERHTPQMQRYREALAHLTGLPPDRIRAILVPLRSTALQEVP